MAGLGSRGQTLVLAWFASVQVMDGKMSAQIQEEIDQERKQGRATYFGETLELLCHLQLQS